MAAISLVSVMIIYCVCLGVYCDGATTVSTSAITSTPTSTKATHVSTTATLLMTRSNNAAKMSASSASIARQNTKQPACKPVRVTQNGRHGSCCVHWDNESTEASKETSPKGVEEGFVPDTRILIDTPQVCPDGQARDVNGDCVFVFNWHVIILHKCWQYAMTN